jgi:hypothetical protein
MKYWHLNTCNDINKLSMIENNVGYIGLGTIDDGEYQSRLTRNGTTPFQYKTFESDSNKGDIILLYHNKEGYIAYGEYDGLIENPCFAPGYSEYEIQKHIKIKEWKPIFNPTTKYYKRKTIVELTDMNIVNKILE